MTDIRARMLAKPTFNNRDVEVPEFGVTVFVQAPTAEQREEYQDLVDAKNTRGAAVHIVATSVVDENGAPLFTHKDAKEIMGWPASVMDRILRAYLDVSTAHLKAMNDAGSGGLGKS